MIAALFIGIIVVLLLVFVVRRRHKAQPHAVPEGEMPVHWRYSDRHVMLAYVYLSGWLLRKSPRDPRLRFDFIQAFFAAQFTGVPFDPQEELKRALNYPVHVRSVANWVNKRLRNPKERKQLMDYLIALACESGPTQMEVVALLRFADLIGVRLAYVEDRLSWYREQQHPDAPEDPLMDVLLNRNVKRRKALEILGLKDPVDLSAIKKAYRSAVQACHPDKVVHLPETEQQSAAAQFRLLQEAYEWLISEV